MHHIYTLKRAPSGLNASILLYTEKNVSVCLPKPGYPNPTVFLPKQSQEDPGLKPLLQLNANTPPTTSMPPRGRSSSTPLLSPPLLIVLVPIIAFAFLFFAVRPFLSLTSHVLRPNTVKKSWDSLNIFLVLFAILCGIFARKNDDGLLPEETANASSASNKTNEGEGEQSTSQQWFRYSETKIYDTPSGAPATGVTRLKRSSSSYPDLRQESLWETGDDRFQFRFFDDFEINKYQSLRHRNEPEEPEKIIPVDTFALRSSPSHPPPPPKSPPPPPTPPQAVHHLPKRTYRTVRRNDDDTESTQTRPPPPPPPIPPPSPARIRSEQKHGKSERSKSSFKKELAMAWNSLYKQRKRKRNKIKTNVFDEQVQSPAEPVRHTRPPPPPPPPPSVFHSLFRKGSKRKKVHSVSTPPPPPPPPPPVRSSRSSERKIPAPPPPPEHSRRRGSSYSTAGRPPLPTRENTWEENVNGVGGRIPVIPMPPLPPPPPFKMPEMRFVAPEGSFRVRSAQSSRCGSPELGDADANKESLDETVNAMDGAGSVFCPSPDVNVKAETFIARLRDGWRLEKMNSYREKEKMGLSPGPGQ
ncbi:uncharacterized protein LOC132165222 [Corylus avellana]|uniref:uncharacterized protein LOC132165222 n=1 Tax=Corylus avellana TaxID=13451 RepID=UPI00286A40C4|nr:uncharacterized protein LOC132165222 [Corylus avellana]